MSFKRNLIPRIFLIVFISGIFVAGFFLGERGFTLNSGHSRPLLTPSPATKPIQKNVLDDVAVMPSEYSIPRSQWNVSERHRFRTLLEENQYDVIVVPFQVEGHGLDRMTRSYMAAYLAAEIRQRSNNSVADPHLVARAIGDGWRRVDTSDVYELARAVGAKLIIWGHAGHSNGAYLRLTIQFQDASVTPIGKKTPVTAYGVRMHKIPAKTHPIDVYAQVVEELLPQLPLDVREQSNGFRGETSASVSLAMSPLKMTGEARSAVQSIYDFHLLAALTPQYADRVRERFAEKAMLALHEVSDQAAEYRLLRARTLMLFGLRPAALSALGPPDSAQERYFREYLNGNLPAASALAAQIQPAQKRLIAELEIAAMAAHYGVYKSAQSTETIAAIGLPGWDWRVLAARALTDRDVWLQADNLQLKKLLGYWFPIDEPPIESLVDGSMTVGEVDKARSVVDFSVHNHARSLLAQNAKSFCCGYDPARPSKLDLLDLVEAMAIGNLARRVELRAVYQGLPQQALEDLDRLDAVYHGHPLLTLMRAQSEFYGVDYVEGVAKQKLWRSAYKNALDAYYWSQGQTHVAAKALETIQYIDMPFYGVLNNPYSTDYPYRPYYVKLHDEVGRDWDIHNALVALDNSAFIVDPLLQLKNLFLKNPGKKSDKFQMMLESIEGRFAGNIEVALIKTEVDYQKGDRMAAERSYREILESKPTQWEPYSRLAKLLFEDGRVSESAEVAMSYPGFMPDSGENVVGVSNHAYEAGSRFFWAGYFPEAVSLYRIAADLKTGSHASITSQLRLNLLNGEMLGALQGSFQRATRYDVPQAYRDYLAILHAMGFSQDAWNGFNALVQQRHDPEPWEAALVGHRASATSEADLVKWARQDAFKQRGNLGNNAASYLLRASVIDRVPSPAVIKVISELDGPVWQANGFTIRFSDPVPGSQSAPVRVGPAAGDLSADASDGPIFKDTPKTAVKSDLVYFAEGYKALHARDYGAALQAFDGASRLFNVSPRAVYAYLLPYMAFAASKAGDTSRIKLVIDRIDPSVKDFDYLLAKAVLSGLSGKTDEAVQLLDDARRHWIPTGERPVFTEYEYAEMVEWLFEQTGKSEFRQIAVEWARICQKTQPWHAWAYAVEAKLSNDSAAKRRAMAMAAYLDPLSERLGSIPKARVKAAVTEFEKENPFRQLQPSRQENVLLDENAEIES